MAYADGIRSPSATLETIASLIEGIGVSGFPLAWTTWAPTYTGSGTLTYGTVTTSYARYIQIGKLVILIIRATGTVAGAGTEIRFTLPVTAAATMTGFLGGWGYVVDAATTSVAVPYLQSTTVAAVLKSAGTNWTAGTDNIAVGLIYEAA